MITTTKECCDITAHTVLLMATSWILPEVTTSTGVDIGAMPTTDLEQAAWDASVMPVSTGTDTDGNSMTVVSVTGDNSEGPTSTGKGAAGTTSTRAIDSDGGATSEQENSCSRLISVGDSFDIVGGGPRTGASPTRVMDSSERSSEPIDGTADSSERWRLIAKDGFVHQSCGDKASLYDNLTHNT